MRPTVRVIGGAPAAALLGFDGFRDVDWPDAWCAPRTARTACRLTTTFRPRVWLPPVDSTCGLVAHPALVLRQLSADIAANERVFDRNHDRVRSLDRLELALEFAFHNDLVTTDQLQIKGGFSGRPLRFLLAQRRNEPATESFAETRFVQLARSFGIVPWRQVWVQVDGREDYRIDFVLPFDDSAARPRLFSSNDGVGVEVNSKQYHPLNFERDYQKGADYNALRLHWIQVTPNQIERQPLLVRKSINGAFLRAGGTPPMSPNLNLPMGFSA
jgi:hypothetical protein